jgi:hypothetical protein
MRKYVRYFYSKREYVMFAREFRESVDEHRIPVGGPPEVSG